MQKVEVHSTDPSGGNIIPGREDGNNDIGNGSTYQIFRNAAATNSGSQQYFAKDKDGVVEPITAAGGGGPSDLEITLFTVGIQSGNNFPITVSAIGGTPPYTYKWYTITSGILGNTSDQALVIGSGLTSPTAQMEVSLGDSVKTIGIVAVRVTDSKGFSQTREYFFEFQNGGN